MLDAASVFLGSNRQSTKEYLKKELKENMSYQSSNLY
jgi:hypothetical protein